MTSLGGQAVARPMASQERPLAEEAIAGKTKRKETQKHDSSTLRLLCSKVSSDCNQLSSDRIRRGARVLRKEKLLPPALPLRNIPSSLQCFAT